MEKAIQIANATHDSRAPKRMVVIVGEDKEDAIDEDNAKINNRR